jgi:hypothetical protein
MNMETRLRLSQEVLGGTGDAFITQRATLVVGAAGVQPNLPNFFTGPIGSMRHIFAVAPTHPLAERPERLTHEIVQTTKLVS